MEHEIVSSARKYLGTPYFYKGRNRGGTDCGGLYILSIRDFIDPDYEYNNYGINPNPNHIKQELLRLTERVDTYESGNILLITLHAAPQHIAIYTSLNTIVHTHSAIGKAVEEKFTKYWKDRVDSIYKLRS